MTSRGDAAHPATWWRGPRHPGDDSSLVRFLQRSRERRHFFALPLLHDFARLGRFCFRRGGLFRDGQDRRGDARDVVRFVEGKEPVVQADVAPHETFVGLLVEATDHRRDAAADAHDGAVHLIPEEARAAHVGADRFVGEPVVIAPDDFLFHVFGQGIDEHLLAERDLRLVLTGHEHLQVRFARDGDDRVAQGRVIVILHLVVPREFHLIDWPALVDRPGGRPAIARDAAEKLALFQAMLAQKGRRRFVIAQRDNAKGRIRAKGHDGRGAAEFPGLLERHAIAEKDEVGLAQRLDRLGVAGGQRDAEDPERFPRLLLPAHDVFHRAEA